mmetsp:Transcript_2998/g.6929  ORF Transcript_2998/g.6929 Transcript_2998/m.6929 type:complete len:722 (-) Transcript_2998:396-2561(-)|eukprot:CAMPEP_0178993858 /NCGR_PEP_ID=MMETSP0795-20121207/6947_1 /TAXON_ID=88552 /ORGANISM="Amoebophrya sp., Strain Ameob2" /LENGTH=721 /DNA_ID=CAMNT_0020685985 /DNA_START=51 /DNA_END=2216 /DNA_ORIENTATION=-
MDAQTLRALRFWVNTVAGRVLRSLRKNAEVEVCSRAFSAWAGFVRNAQERFGSHATSLRNRRKLQLWKRWRTCAVNRVLLRRAFGSFVCLHALRRRERAVGNVIRHRRLRQGIAVLRAHLEAVAEQRRLGNRATFFAAFMTQKRSFRWWIGSAIERRKKRLLETLAQQHVLHTRLRFKVQVWLQRAKERKTCALATKVALNFWAERRTPGIVREWCAYAAISRARREREESALVMHQEAQREAAIRNIVAAEDRKRTAAAAAAKEAAWEDMRTKQRYFRHWLANCAKPAFSLRLLAEKYGAASASSTSSSTTCLPIAAAARAPALREGNSTQQPGGDLYDRAAGGDGFPNSNFQVGGSASSSSDKNSRTTLQKQSRNFQLNGAKRALSGDHTPASLVVITENAESGMGDATVTSRTPEKVPVGRPAARNNRPAPAVLLRSSLAECLAYSESQRSHREDSPGKNRPHHLHQEQDVATRTPGNKQSAISDSLGLSPSTDQHEICSPIPKRNNHFPSGAASSPAVSVLSGVVHQDGDAGGRQVDYATEEISGTGRLRLERSCDQKREEKENYVTKNSSLQTSSEPSRSPQTCTTAPSSARPELPGPVNIARSRDENSHLLLTIDDHHLQNDQDRYQHRSAEQHSSFLEHSCADQSMSTLRESRDSNYSNVALFVKKFAAGGNCSGGGTATNLQWTVPSRAKKRPPPRIPEYLLNSAISEPVDVL